MEAQTDLPSVPYDREAVYTALTDFDESDPEFQAGIQTIIGPMQSSGVAPAQIEETKKRAKVFFWSQKTGNQVDYSDYTAWLATKSAAASEANGAITTESAAASSGTTDAAASEGAKADTDKEPYPASFDAIVELITTGKTDQIPGIRDIPLKINEEPPTQPTMDRPLKPWEKAGVVPVELAPTNTEDTTATTAPSNDAEATQKTEHASS